MRSTKEDERVVSCEGISLRVGDRGGSGIKSRKSPNGSGDSLPAAKSYCETDAGARRACWFEGGGPSLSTKREGEGEGPTCPLLPYRGDWAIGGDEIDGKRSKNWNSWKSSKEGSSNWPSGSGFWLRGGSRREKDSCP